jgi:hypothetical protein
MFGTLKGFAKFLFDSPTKDTSITNESLRQKLELHGDKASYIAMTEKAFIVYSKITNNLYYVNEDFKI